MTQMIPLFLAEEENYSSMERQRIFRDLTDPLYCYDQRYRLSISSISRITELMSHRLKFTDRSHAAVPHLQVCVALQFLLLERSR